MIAFWVQFSFLCVCVCVCFFPCLIDGHSVIVYGQCNNDRIICQDTLPINKPNNFIGLTTLSFLAS